MAATPFHTISTGWKAFGLEQAAAFLAIGDVEAKHIRPSAPELDLDQHRKPVAPRQAAVAATGQARAFAAGISVRQNLRAERTYRSIPRHMVKTRNISQDWKDQRRKLRQEHPHMDHVRLKLSDRPA